MNTVNGSGPEKTSGSDPAPLLLDAAGVAALLFVSKATIWRWHDMAKIPAPIKIGSVVRWRRADVLAWIEVEFRKVAPRA